MKLATLSLALALALIANPIYAENGTAAETTIGHGGETPTVTNKAIEEKADVVIVGGGGAGLSAALAAAQNGLSVIVVEKNDFLGGDTFISNGCFNAVDPEGQAGMEMTDTQLKIIKSILEEKPRSELQAKLIETLKEQFEAYQKAGYKGLFDSPELHALQSWKAGDYKGNLELVYQLATYAPEMRKILASLGIKWTEPPTEVVGALYPRSHQDVNFESGKRYANALLGEIKAKKYPVTFMLSTKAEDLIDEGGRIVGVNAKGPEGKQYVLLGSKGVVLTSGGFGANVEMRTHYDTVWGHKLDETIKTTNLPSNTGDGIKMAEKAGAQLQDMGYIQLLSTADPVTGSTNNKIMESTNIYVNKLGNRFVNALEKNKSDLAKAVLAQPDHLLFVIGTDRSLIKDKDGRTPYGFLVEDLVQQHRAYKANSLEELASQLGMNPDNLKITVEKWNKFCETQKGDEFGRTSCDEENILSSPPFYASPMSPAVNYTMGGVLINKEAQVLSTSGKPIPGLYAAGEVTGGIHGAYRVICNGVPDALVYGRIAGQSVAKEK
ncbi:MAG: FAD-dependent oxidoreductase [Burkholderiales bacterium]|nr:FAD-dependent oxidoreductase [Burkholderiales bacterium]